MALRPYQQEIYEEIPRRLAKDQSVLVQAPARSGKSHVISETTNRIVSTINRLPPGKIPVVLTHRGKIQEQLIKHCNGISIDSKVEHLFICPGHCFVAMHQTLIKRTSIIEQLYSLGDRIVLLIDEAHRGDFNKMFIELPQARRIGFSATPAWKWAKWLPTYYASLIHGPQVLELTAQGNITPIEYYEMRSDLDTLRKGSNGEYTEESQFATFDRAKLYDGLFDELNKFTFNKCIIFCASKKSADALGVQFKQHAPQYNVTTFYSGKDKKDLTRFTESNEANVLITVSALSEGFDHPPIDMNVLWRATSSLPLFIQMGMRGATPYTGKHKTTVLDFGGNNSRFGGQRGLVALTMDRDWNVLWQPPEELPRLSNGVAAIKNCPACDFIISAMAKSCCNCGFIYPDAEIVMKQGELVKIENDLEQTRQAANKLTGRKISQLSAQELALYAKEKDKKSFGMRVAKALGTQNANYLVEYGKAMGYKSMWADRQIKEIAEIQMYEPDYKIDFHDVIIR